MKALEIICLVVWLITGLALTAFSYAAIRFMMAFIAWLVAPENKDFTGVLLGV